MTENDILEKLSEISDVEWKKIIKKCKSHINTKLYGLTLYGAHCEQRLGMKAEDYYFFRAYESVCSGVRTWNYIELSIEKQLIGDIDSLIHNEVKKFEVERKHNRRTVLTKPDQLGLFNQIEDSTELVPAENIDKLKQALIKACEDNERYKLFVDLKEQGYKYEVICEKMNCSKNEAYQMQETIAKRAKKILKLL